MYKGSSSLERVPDWLKVGGGVELEWGHIRRSPLGGGSSHVALNPLLTLTLSNLSLIVLSTPSRSPPNGLHSLTIIFLRLSVCGGNSGWYLYGIVWHSYCVNIGGGCITGGG